MLKELTHVLEISPEETAAKKGTLQAATFLGVAIALIIGMFLVK